MSIKITITPTPGAAHFNSVEIQGTADELHTLNNNLRNSTLSYAAIETGIFTASYLGDEIVKELKDVVVKLNKAEYIAYNKNQANGRAIPRRVVPIAKYVVGDTAGKFKIVRLGKAWRVETQQKYKHHINAGVEFVQYAYFE